MRPTRFHGRHDDRIQECQAPGCDEAGQFRAPGPRSASFDGPGDSLWFCLDHVREFNAKYDWFEGMSAEEILDAQHPAAGWRNSSTRRVFGADAAGDGMPRWADFDDPLDAIGARANGIRNRARDEARFRSDAARFTRAEQDALMAMELSPDIDRQGLRRRYSELVRLFHPDRNGGDRSHEDRLRTVVEAYQLLRRSAALA
jgi:hypothetical protein